MKIINILLTAFLVNFTTILFAQKTEESTSKAIDHAPIGVMGDHMHKKGEFMLSYRFMYMQMEGNRVGTDEVSETEIATTVPNVFFGNPMQPPTLRVVPTEMPMQMHMIGAMYAPTDWLTIMTMGMFVQKDMTHTTFQGGMGTNILGTFETSTSGIGDTKLAFLLRLLQKNKHHIHANVGLSIPTGSITETDEILTPMNMRPTPRLPYPMQLGSGTFDPSLGVTYTGKTEKIAWGGQASYLLRLGENEENYTFGNQFSLQTWGMYGFANWISASLRFSFYDLQSIDGQDSNIVAPVQTANPDFHGGQGIDTSFGVNLLGTKGFTKDFRLGLEFDLPIYQDLNGPQLETDYNITVGLQYAF